MVWCCHPNESIVLLSVVFSLTFSLANSYVADTGIDYETEDALSPTDDQLPASLSLSRIFHNSYRLSGSAEENDLPASETREAFSKRSRFYRKYPGKRQNRHYSDLYDCTPSPTETVRLLYAIHQARLGDIEHIVFCNRVRNPKGILPNPRYVGKRNTPGFE